MVIGNIVDNVARLAETAVDGVAETLFEPVIRLGVTGLSRSGKTVFITSLVANLLERGRMPQFQAAATGRIEAAFLQPQPNDTLPRFDYENHLTQMTGKKPMWPHGTHAISQLRVSLRVQPSGMITGLRGPRIVHLDIVDYPGEWLLDLPLMHQSFSEWSAEALELARSEARIEHSKEFLGILEKTDGAEQLEEPRAQALAKAFTSYLVSCREAGLSACAPGRFLMPGDLQGSPALTFCPLQSETFPRGSLSREFSRRYEAYKSAVVTPFFRDHFSRIDRQIVLVDALGAIHAGPRAVKDLEDAMADVLACFRVGQNSFLSRFIGKRVERILFAATKADQIHHNQHDRLTAIMTQLVKDAKSRVEFKGVESKAIAIAALRCTVERSLDHDGEMLDAVQGRLLETGKDAVMFAGDLPRNPADLMNDVEAGSAEWLDADYSVMKFAPAASTMKPGEGPPHIRLDQVAEYLIGDRLP